MLSVFGAKKPPRFVIFARHGRTFASGQTAVWLGRDQDDPLSAPGLEDASALGEGLRASNIPLAFAHVSPQLRARQTLELASRIVCRGSDKKLLTRVDERLAELDFGRWTGSSQAELEARGEGAAARAWTQERLWPRGIGFMPTEASVWAEAESYLADCCAQLALLPEPTPQAALVVAHGARLRFVLASLTRLTTYAPPQDKLGCGQVGVVRMIERAGGIDALEDAVVARQCFEPIAWNIAPRALGAVLEGQS